MAEMAERWGPLYISLLPHTYRNLEEKRKKNVLVLCVAILPKWIPGFSAIPSENVQVSIQTKQQLASVVVRSWLLDLQNDPEWRGGRGRGG